MWFNSILVPCLVGSVFGVHVCVYLCTYVCIYTYGVYIWPVG